MITKLVHSEAGEKKADYGDWPHRGSDPGQWPHMGSDSGQWPHMGSDPAIGNTWDRAIASDHTYMG